MAKPTDKPEETVDIDQVEVRLPTVLGIRPHDYILGVYAVLIALLLFAVFILPGIRKNGSRVRFTSRPDGAAVYVDGLYAGATPVQVFVEKGPHTFRIERGSFVPVETAKDVRGRIVGSLFFPRRETVSAELAVKDVDAYVSSALRELADWALVDRFGRSYQPPSLIAKPVADLLSVGPKEESLAAVDRFMDVAFAHVRNEALLADAIGGVLARAARGGLLTPAALAETVSNIIQLATRYKNLPFLVLSCLDRATADSMLQTPWAVTYVGDYSDAMRAVSPASRQPVRLRSVAGTNFVEVSGDTFTQGLTSAMDGTYLHSFPVDVGSFYLQAGEVTVGMYRQFLRQNPKWAPANANALVEAGLASDHYLRNYDLQPEDAEPVQYVSYFAAEAFCRWFTDQLPEEWNGYEARLPFESEWEFAATVFADPATEPFAGRRSGPDPVGARPGLEHLLGNMWQWTATWYYPAAYYCTDWDPGTPETLADEWAAETDGPVGAERVVRGGSWANSAVDGIGISTRGSQPPAWCTQFTGFRMVLAPGDE